MKSKNTVLIVDDEPLGRKTLKALLLPEGYRMDFAGSGQEALDLVLELKPDVILLDVMMPEMDGFEVCRRLRATPKVAEVPVIMVTALDDRDSRLRGIEAGADEFISKPFDQTELRTRVRTITNLNRYRRLHAERTKFESVVEQTDDGYLIMDEQDRILYANPQAKVQLHLPTDDNGYTNSFLNLAKRHYQAEPQAAWDSWPNPTTEDLARYLVQPASEMSDAVWLEVELLNIQADIEDGRLVRLRNVTSAIEDQRLMWSFHGQLSHKLKTPLTLLDGFTRFLTEDCGNLSPEDRDHYSEQISTNVTQLRRQIMSIFDYLDLPDVARLNPGKGQVSELSAIICKVGATFNETALKVVNTANEQATIPLSASVMNLILQELFQNAQKFHPQHTPALKITLSDTADYLCLQVADDGQTLSATQLARLWTPYYQAERGFSGQLPGMGLGLPTVASFVWNVGGTCRAYNRVDGPGIVLELLIPLLKNQTIELVTRLELV